MMIGSWAKIGGALFKWGIPVIAGITLLVVIRNHISYVNNLEQSNQELVEDKAKLRSQLDQVTDTNRENERLANEYRSLQKVNKQIGDAEDLIAATRNDFYERIRDDISKTGNVGAEPCSFSLVNSTLERLWKPSS